MPDVTITAAGFLPFHFGVGDHRGIYIDIPHSSFLGSTLRKIERPNARRLQCNREKVKKKYVDSLEIFMRQHKIKQKLGLLHEANNIPKEMRKTILESIDRTIGDGMQMAEKRCRNLAMGEVPYSPELANAGLKMKIWNLVIHR